MSGLPARARVVVIGTGAFGTAAALRFARRLGDEVLVLEQFEPGHTKGASEDRSRIVRHSYGSPVYTAVTPAAFAASIICFKPLGLFFTSTSGSSNANGS